MGWEGRGGEEWGEVGRGGEGKGGKGGGEEMRRRTTAVVLQSSAHLLGCLGCAVVKQLLSIGTLLGYPKDLNVVLGKDHLQDKSHGSHMVVTW